MLARRSAPFGRRYPGQQRMGSPARQPLSRPL